MFIVNLIHFGFSDWTIGGFNRMSNLVLGQIILITYLLSTTTNVNGQRLSQPNVPSSISPPPPQPRSPPLAPVQPTKCPYSSEEILGVIFTSVIVTIFVIGLTLLLFWCLWKKKIINFSGGKTYLIRDVDLNDKTIQIDATKQQQQKRQQHSNGKLSSDEDNQYKRLIKSLPPLTSVFNHLSNQSKGPIKSLDDTFIMTKPEQVSVQMTGHDFTGLGFNICGNMRDGIFIKDLLNRGPANESGLIKAGDRIMSITVSCEKMVYEDALTILSYASPYDVTLQIEKTSKSKVTTPNGGGGTGNGNVYLPRRYANGFSGSSDTSNHRILHPVFRSHSVGELTTRLSSCNGDGSRSRGGCGGDGDAVDHHHHDKSPSLEEKSFGSIKSINSLLRKIKTSLYRSTASIKSHQSGKGKMTTDYCSTNGLNYGPESGYHRSCYSLDASELVNGQISPNSSYVSSTNNMNASKSSEIAIIMSPKEPIITTISHLSSSIPFVKEGQVINNFAGSTITESPRIEKPIIEEPMMIISSESLDEMGQSRKVQIQGKRKAPAPPSPSSSTCSIEIKSNEKVEGECNIIGDNGNIVAIGNHYRTEQRSTTPGGSKVQTHADIHREQGSTEDFSIIQDQSLSDVDGIKSPAIDVSLSLAMESMASDTSMTEPLAINLVKEMKVATTNGRSVRAPSPSAGKSKSCSMSDLTGTNKKTTAAIILERAVSLDLRDQLGPEENKILQQGAIIEDGQGLLRWSETKPSVGGPDSLSTTYSSEMLGSTSKTNDFTDDSLTITIDGSIEKSAPKPAERTSLKRNSLSNSTDSRLRSNSRLETIDIIINEEENIVAPPDGFGSSDRKKSEISSSSSSSPTPFKPSVEDVKLKPNLKAISSMKLDESLDDDNATPKVQLKKLVSINESAIKVEPEDKSSINTHNAKTKPSIPEKPLTLSSKFKALSPSQERLDSTLFDVQSKTPQPSVTSFKDDKAIVNGFSHLWKDGDKTVKNVNSLTKTTTNNNNKYPIEPEVIEISPSELSQVRLAHEKFLAQQSKPMHGKFSRNHSNFVGKSSLNGGMESVVGGNISSKGSPVTRTRMGELEDNDFESWSYLSDIESNLPSLSDEKRYLTTCDMGQLNEETADEVFVEKV